MRLLTCTAAVFGFLLVATAALGAHLVFPHLGDARPDADPPEAVIRRWDQAILFGFMHVLAALAACRQGASRLALASGWAFVAGVVLFSGVQVFRIWTGATHSSLAGLGASLGGLVPVGGVSLMAGWLLLAASALASREQKP